MKTSGERSQGSRPDGGRVQTGMDSECAEAKKGIHKNPTYVT